MALIFSNNEKLVVTADRSDCLNGNGLLSISGMKELDLAISKGKTGRVDGKIGDVSSSALLVKTAKGGMPSLLDIYDKNGRLVVGLRSFAEGKTAELIYGVGIGTSRRSSP